MDMSNVKTLFDNNVQKNVKKITDANGNIMWYKVTDGYRKVEYLESSNGTSYIDTSLIPTSTIKAQIKFQLNTTCRNNAGFFGAFSDAGVGNRFQMYLSNSQGYLSFGLGKGSNGSNLASSLSTSTHVAVFDAKNLTISLDGVQQPSLSGTYSSPAENNQPIYIFASNNYSSKTPNNSKIWAVMIWDNDILIRYFIPVVRNADDKPGMYDLVNDVFYTNAGTGEFTWKEIDGPLLGL